jgi:hypothetical protein
MTPDRYAVIVRTVENSQNHATAEIEETAPNRAFAARAVCRLVAVLRDGVRTKHARKRRMAVAMAASGVRW